MVLQLKPPRRGHPQQHLATPRTAGWPRARAQSCELGVHSEQTRGAAKHPQLLAAAAAGAEPWQQPRSSPAAPAPRWPCSSLVKSAVCDSSGDHALLQAALAQPLIPTVSPAAWKQLAKVSARRSPNIGAVELSHDECQSRPGHRQAVSSQHHLRALASCSTSVQATTKGTEQTEPCCPR